MAVVNQTIQVVCEDLDEYLTAIAKLQADSRIDINSILDDELNLTITADYNQQEHEV